MTRIKIKHRNAITELWNDGVPMPEMCQTLGLSLQKVQEYLAVAKRGFNTPRDEQEFNERLENAKLERELAKAANKAARPKKSRLRGR